MERWLPVAGVPGYEVSDQGRVRSLDRHVHQGGSKRSAACSRFVRGRLLRPGPSKSGHLTVVLGRANGSSLVHHLVLNAFVGPCPKGLEGRHLDGDHTNNAFSNLVWDTRGNNTRDKKWHNGCSTYKLKPPQIAEIKTRLQNVYRGLGVELAAEFGVSQSVISAIKHDRLHIDV